MSARLGAAALARPAPELAPELLGCELRLGGVRAVITEVEAYHGEDDRACHASRGRTPRNDVLFRQPGTVYCYLCYGIHVLLNLVCDRAGVPSAVLVRSVLVTAGERAARARRGQPGVPLARLANGPGKVTQALGIDLALNGARLDAADCPLRLYRGVSADEIVTRARVGVAYAGAHWAAMPWRFHLAGFPVARG